MNWKVVYERGAEQPQPYMFYGGKEMPVTLPLEVYEVFERKFGKEDAKKVVKSLETTISDVTEYKWKVTKDELLDAIRKEFVTRELFEERINTLRTELLGRVEKGEAELLGRMEKGEVELLGRMEKNKIELEGKIEKEGLRLENKIVTLDRKFTIMFIILFFTIIFLNQNALEFLARVFGLIR